MVTGAASAVFEDEVKIRQVEVRTKGRLRLRQDRKD
jgi:hypothetical protein